ncbi:MAG: helix-turn-helix transcriptional regulator [Nitrososphaerota archaeon]|nr:helix-turn-helix transcriptional regulator [Nitrososphaerota archaeon]MDG7049244.1 helix-turn-helix transcriptional regulator [Nitrososphaerota archaeon]MDG7051620.1 helix-turn-helix transcriptional regulator [Nitrososphaerota archaeon]
MTDNTNGDICVCALEGAMDLLGKKWTIFTINAIGNHASVRFKDLYSELRGISPSTLSSILHELESRGLISRKSFPEIPPRVEYKLTDAGMDLREAIIPLLIWASKQDEYAKRADECDPSQYVRVSRTAVR